MQNNINYLNYFYKKLLELYDECLFEIKAIRERDPAARNNTEVALLYSGFHAVMAYRAAHTLYKAGYFFTARCISQTARLLTGIEIHPGAEIGQGLFIDHGSGVVIGETTKIGNNCTIYQGATLGGTGKQAGKRHPTLGNNIMVGAGAKILGPIKIGDNSKIAAGAVVLAHIPENSTAVGIPARVVRHNNRRVEHFDLDQLHVPDPVSQELCELRYKLEQLEKKINLKIENIEKTESEK